MAHSSFIDSDVVSTLTENYIAENELKVEIETHNVNDDENVAVEVLGQLGGSNCDLDIEEVPLVVKTEETSGCSYVEDMQLEAPKEENVSAHAVVMDIEDAQLVIADEGPETKLVLLDGNHMPAIDEDHVANPFDVRHDYLVCTICGYDKFTDDSELQNHMYVHSNNVNYPIPTDISTRPYSCDSCHMMFQRKSSLKNHSKIHSHGNVRTGDEFSYSNGKETNGVEVSGNKRKRKAAVNKNNDTRIPPFETLKPNSAVTGYPAVQAVDNLFNTWRTDNEKSNMSNGVDIVSGVISVKPISALTSRNEPMMYPEDEHAHNSQNKEKPYTCPFCTRTFAREKAMMNHIRIHNDNYDMTLECQRCRMVFEDIISLQAHLVVCVIPDSVASMVQDALNDQEELPPPLDFNPIEVKAFTYNSHSHANVGEHVCNVCHKRFKTRQKVFRHMWVHRKKIYTCEICGLPFPGIKYLDEHRLSLHPSTGPFACLQCGKSFMSKQGLTEHGRLHKGWSEQYYCSFCQKYFSSRQGYTIHGRIHTGERPYGCKFCPKFFRDGGTLKKHERIHTGERPHECPLCHKRYNQKVVLREHIRGVHVMKRNSEINSECPICNISNLGKDELSEHIVRHSDELMRKSKQDFTTKQKSLAKGDNRIPIRRRRMKKTSPKENHVNVGSNEGSEAHNLDELDVHSYKAQTKEPQQPRTKRKITKKRSVDVKNSGNKIKAVDRFKTKKTTTTTKKIKKKKPTVAKQKKYAVKKIATNDKKRKHVDETKPSLVTNKKDGKSEVFKESNNQIVSQKSKDSFDDDDEEEEEVENSPPEKVLEECEMCHEKFSTRNDLIAHVFVHI